MTIEALPSYWRGTVFRSRTEARWAVFFDAIGLRWEYEPEGYRLEDGAWYLPDFWLPDMRLWAEVKPDDGAGPGERSKIEQLVVGSRYSCLVLAGAPWPHPYEECSHGLSPDGFAWTRSHFSDAYTLERKDGAPRMFSGSEDYEADQEEGVAAAMGTARRMDLKDPDAGDYLPMGWEGIEPAWVSTEAVELPVSEADVGEPTDEVGVDVTGGISRTPTSTSKPDETRTTQPHPRTPHDSERNPAEP